LGATVSCGGVPVGADVVPVEPEEAGELDATDALGEEAGELVGVADVWVPPSAAGACAAPCSGWETKCVADRLTGATVAIG
jgi:hypothetical protein